MCQDVRVFWAVIWGCVCVLALAWVWCLCMCMSLSVLWLFYLIFSSFMWYQFEFVRPLFFLHCSVPITIYIGVEEDGSRVVREYPSDHYFLVLAGGEQEKGKTHLVTLSFLWQRRRSGGPLFEQRKASTSNQHLKSSLCQENAEDQV